MRALLIAFTALIAFLSPVWAGPALAAPVTLKTDVANDNGRITLGDLFDGAGPAGGTVIGMRTGSTAVLDAASVQLAARRVGLEWDNPQGLRRIIVHGGASTGNAPAARGNVEVLTYARSLSVGDIVQPEDLVWAKVAAAPANAPRDVDDVVGLVTRRPVREGAAVSGRDISAPQAIKSGDLVAVTWSDGGITLTLQAKAAGSAAVGQPFNAINLSSKKVIEVVATGPGQAISGPQADQLKASRSPAQFASR